MIRYSHTEFRLTAPLGVISFAVNGPALSFDMIFFLFVSPSLGGGWGEVGRGDLSKRVGSVSKANFFLIPERVLRKKQ
jgi:hypothetical protein